MGAPAAAVSRILVASTELPAGALMTAESVRWQAWPAGDPATDYLAEGKARPQDLAGAVVRARLAQGEPITAGKVVHPGDQGFMAAVLTPGMTAITINVGANTSMAGFVMPGDRVNLILTMSLAPRVNEKNGVTRHVSETMLSDLRVLGMDQAYSDVKKAGKTDLSVPRTATLEVTRKQAEVISVAADMGILSLGLRSVGRPAGWVDPADQTHTWDVEAAKGILYGPPSDASHPGAGAPQRSVAPQRRVIIVRGVSVSEMSVGPRAPGRAIGGATTP